MSCKRGNIDEFYFVRWSEPEVSDADTILAEVRDLKGQRNDDLHYIAIVGAELKPPSDEVRASMKKSIDELLTHCRSVHLVIEGRGFRRAMARSIGTSIFLLSKNRGRTFAHDTVAAALAEVGVDGARAQIILGEAATRELVTPA